MKFSGMTRTGLYGAFKSNLIISLFLLSACAVGPDYERPQVETPSAFKEAGNWQKAEPMDAVNRGAWWAVYHDKILNGLEKQVDVSNQNLKAAEAAYRESQAAVDQTRAGFFPTVALGSSAIKSGSGVPRSASPTTYTLSASGSWAPDVWGRIRRSLESGEANAAASEADLASARLSAQAALAEDYFDLRMQDALKRVLVATVKADAQTLKIVQNQYAAGIAAETDVLAAKTQLENVQASAINVGVRRAQLEHAIAVLIGKPPAEFSLAPAAYSIRVPNIPAGVPSQLLERRPDIASAERQMASANAAIGVATSAWFPALTLSGSAGSTAVQIGKLLQASTNVWSFGPALAETIFDAGAREAAVEQARAAYDQSVANYRQTVLTGFQQVEDNLAALRVLAEQAKAENLALSDARKSEAIALNQYKEGIVPYNSVLAAQVAALATEQTALTVQQNRIDASVALIQSLGGGWSAKLTK